MVAFWQILFEGAIAFLLKKYSGNPGLLLKHEKMKRSLQNNYLSEKYSKNNTL